MSCYASPTVSHPDCLEMRVNMNNRRLRNSVPHEYGAVSSKSRKDHIRSSPGLQGHRRNILGFSMETTACQNIAASTDSQSELGFQTKKRVVG